MAQNPRQPQMPTLSAAAARANHSKTPLTPKVAPAVARSPTPRNQHRTVTVTPAPRRPPVRPGSSLGSGHDHPDSSSSLLSANAPPRSATRKPRIDGATDQDPDSKFFYASQAPRSSPQPSERPRSSAPPPQPPSQKTTFFYANGTNVPERQGTPQPTASPADSSVVSGPSPTPQENRASKFFYANATLTASAPVAATSTPSAPSRLAASRLAPSSITPAGQRPPSPIKLPFSSPQARNLHSSGNDSSSALSTPLSPRSTISPGPPPLVASTPLHAHRRSIDSPSLASAAKHARTRSLTVADPPAVARVIATSSSRTSSRPPSEASSPRSPSEILPPPAATGFSSLLQAADEIKEPDEPASAKSEAAEDEKDPNDLVARARRERKVQDLEITNASLEAINRTLERQLRRQTAELRRYRRLSRSGRLSLSSSAVPARGERIASDSTAGGGALARAGLELDDLSEEESDSDEDSDGGGEISLFGGDNASETASEVAAEDGRASRRQRDEERLQLDLSKHQQLLTDSQKMNQSLKRCLGWTEELIRDGRRALEYRVCVSEVQLGGRVLNPEDMEDEAPIVVEDDMDDLDEVDNLDLEDHDDDETLHGPSLLLPSSPGGAAVGNAQEWPKQDRDSGIELQG